MTRLYIQLPIRVRNDRACSDKLLMCADVSCFSTNDSRVAQFILIIFSPQPRAI